MRILITNDDGLNAAQLPNLIRWARKLGQVTAFVPKFEQSGKSHSFEIRKPFEAKQVQLAPDITVSSGVGPGSASARSSQAVSA